MGILEAITGETSRGGSADRVSRGGFFGASALLFAASAAATVLWCRSMSATGGMTMAGGRASMDWMPMPGQTWPGAAVSFLGMWVAMMGAMMLPSLVPALWRYRRAVDGAGAMRRGWLTALAGAGYFFVWTVFGMAVFPLGVAWMAIKMRVPVLAHMAPVAVGVLVLIGGAVQLSTWKARRLACCRKLAAHSATQLVEAGTAWRHGLRLGLQCGGCCVNLMAIAMVLGLMDLRVMAVVTAAITLERLAPAGEHIARFTGVVAVGAGLVLIARAAGLA